MAKIDDDIEQAREQYLGASEPFASSLTREAFKKGFPILSSVLTFWQSREQRQIQIAFNNCVLDLLKARDQRIDNLQERMTPELNRIAAAAFERILWGASEQKATRFAAVLAHEIAAVPDNERYEDAASFIRALDELSEADIKALRHLHRFQRHLVSEGRTVSYRPFFENGLMEQLLQTVDMKGDEFFARCARLTGYGLALELERRDNIGSDMRAYRITILGRRLVDILLEGEKTYPDEKS